MQGEVISAPMYRVSREEKEEFARLSAERLEKAREEGIPNIRERYELLVKQRKDDDNIKK